MCHTLNKLDCWRVIANALGSHPGTHFGSIHLLIRYLGASVRTVAYLVIGQTIFASDEGLKFVCSPLRLFPNQSQLSSYNSWLQKVWQTPLSTKQPLGKPSRLADSRPQRQVHSHDHRPAVCPAYLICRPRKGRSASTNNKGGFHTTAAWLDVTRCF